MTVDWDILKDKLQVPKDEDAAYDNDSLTNRDIIPIPPERRTWSWFGYVTYWLIEAVSISGYTTGSSLVGIGLSVKQSICVSMAAGIIYGFMAAIMGYIGSHHHIGFPVFARVMYGIKGSVFGIVIRIITGIVWFGAQAYYGGEAIRVCLGAMSPRFLEWDTFHNKNDITSRDFVGLFLYCIFITPCYFIPPERVQVLFRIVTVITVGAFFGLLGFCVRKADGPGKMFSESSAVYTTSGALGWACVKGIFSIVGTAGTGILGQSDFTRYSKTKNGPIYAQIIGAPCALVFSCVVGILTTSASHDFLGGEVIWNPINLLTAIQGYENNSPAARAAVFFGGLAFVLQQLGINVLLNSFSSAMDMVGLCPKYINIRRGSFIVLCIGILIWPWKILTSAKAVIVFGNGWGCFCSPQTGILIAKYFIIYRKKVLLKDLYIDSPESIYWFYNGIDWRSIIAFFAGTVFLMPGLAFDANGTSNGFWTWIYKVSYLWGLFIAAGVTLALNYIFPAKTISPTTKVDDIYNNDGSRLEVYDSPSENNVEEVQIPFHAKGEMDSSEKI